MKEKIIEILHKYNQGSNELIHLIELSDLDKVADEILELFLCTRSQVARFLKPPKSNPMQIFQTNELKNFKNPE